MDDEEQGWKYFLWEKKVGEVKWSKGWRGKGKRVQEEKMNV